MSTGHARDAQNPGFSPLLFEVGRVWVQGTEARAARPGEPGLRTRTAVRKHPGYRRVCKTPQPSPRPGVAATPARRASDGPAQASSCGQRTDPASSPRSQAPVLLALTVRAKLKPMSQRDVSFNICPGPTLLFEG